MATLKCKACQREIPFGRAGEPCPHCGSKSNNLTSEEQAVLKDKARVARYLAQRYTETEPSITVVFTIWDKRLHYEAQPSTPIKLLQVNRNAPPSGVILPLGFDAAPSSGVPYPSVIMSVTPDEFSKIRSEELKLPRGWVLGEPVSAQNCDT
jgi:hypothetical protein